MWEWLRKNKYPEEFRILCFNCNQAGRGIYTCPHLLTSETKTKDSNC